jgi:hypothetical protein
MIPALTKTVSTAHEKLRESAGDRGRVADVDLLHEDRAGHRAQLLFRRSVAGLVPTPDRDRGAGPGQRECR